MTNGLVGLKQHSVLARSLGFLMVRLNDQRRRIGRPRRLVDDSDTPCLLDQNDD